MLLSIHPNWFRLPPNHNLAHPRTLPRRSSARNSPEHRAPSALRTKEYQYKRTAAIVGDVCYHAPRLVDARAYAKYSPTYIYRFNTRPFVNSTDTSSTDPSGSLAPAYKGVEHASELPFTFGNPSFTGIFGGYEDLRRQMSAQWVAFIHGGNPNADDSLIPDPS